MPNLTAQIKASGNCFQVRPTPKVKQKKQLKKVSKRRAVEGKIYRAKRGAYLAAHPFCEAGAIFMGSFTKCKIFACDVHHRAGRLAGNYLDESTWLPVCRPCHDYIHSHPKQARQLGLLV